MLRPSLTIAFSLALFLSQPVTAAGLIPASADRSVFVTATSICGGCGPDGEDTEFSGTDQDDTQAFGAYDVQVQAVGSGSGQDSLVSTRQLSGFGFVSLGFSVISEGSSTYQAFFQVDETSIWSLTGELSTGAASQIRVSDSTGDLVDLNNDAGLLVFDESLNLVAGHDYELFATVSNDFGVSGDWSFLLVPEPASGLLAMLGLVGLCLGRRRRVWLAPP
jgi:MYXO-CTERM domain-containing protein